MVAGINYLATTPTSVMRILKKACWKSTGELLTDEELEIIDESDAYEEIFEQALGI